MRGRRLHTKANNGETSNRESIEVQADSSGSELARRRRLIDCIGKRGITSRISGPPGVLDFIMREPLRRLRCIRLFYEKEVKRKHFP